MALILCLALQEARVTLELRDVPLREAAERALKPFGHTTEWIKEPEPSKRVDLSLKDAGYFQTLDAVCGLAGLPKVEAEHHRSVSPLIYCGNYLMGRRTLAVLDLTAALRLIVVLTGLGAQETHLELILLFTPGQARPPGVFEALRINGRENPSPAQFLGWNRQEGYPTYLHFGLTAPPQKAGESIQLAGELVLEDVRLPFQTKRVVIPAYPVYEEVETASTGQTPRYTLVLAVGGLAVIVGLLLAALRRRATSGRSGGSGS